MAVAKKKKTGGKKTPAGLRALGREDLVRQLAEERRNLLDMRCRHAAAQLEQTSALKASRRLIAKLETILKEKE